MSFGTSLGRKLLGFAAITAVLTIDGDLPAREDGRKTQQPAPVKAASPEVKYASSWASDWVAKMSARNGPFKPEQLATAKGQAAATLKRLETEAADLPDGAIWRKTWQLDQLGKQLAAPKTDLAAIQTTAKSLAAQGPIALEPARRTLTYLLGNWIGLVRHENNREHATSTDNNIFLLAFAADRQAFGASEHVAVSSETEQRGRQAFRELAALRRFDDLLAEYRAKVSGFNYRVRMTDDYIEQESRKHFELPVAFPSNAGGMQISVRGTAVSDATVEVVPNDSRGELRVSVASVGRFGLTGRKNKMTFSATSLQRMTATQPMYLDAAAIETPGPTVRDRSCTSLNWVQVCTRLPMVSRIASRIARPIAAKKLSQQDPTIARKVEDQVRERVAEEGYDIAHRINGKFGVLASEIFPADGDAPRLTIRSTSDDITWSALYADADELGALAPPPETLGSTAMPEFEVRHWAHESAAENWGTRLSGKPLDEATFHLLLKEDLKLFGKELDALPPLRTPAVLLFQPGEPLGVKFRDQAVELELRLQGYSMGAEVKWNSPRVVKLRYRVVADAKGMRLVRDQEDYLKDAAWKKVLDHFLPAVLEPLPRFHNGNFKTRLTTQLLVITDGWLMTGANRVTETPPTSVEEVAADKVAASRVAPKVVKE